MRPQLERKERMIGGASTLSGALAEPQRVQGSVKNVPTENKHYGFIRVKGIAQDVFVPKRIIKESGQRDQFVLGATVECNVESRDRGPCVTMIHKIHPA